MYIYILYIYYIYIISYDIICIHGIMRFTHNYPQISIRYQSDIHSSRVDPGCSSGMLWLMVSTKKLSRSMGDEASPERSWLEVPKALGFKIISLYITHWLILLKQWLMLWDLWGHSKNIILYININLIYIYIIYK